MLPLFDDGFITLDEEDGAHRYFNKNGQEYNSVSSVIKSVVEPFDAKRISRNMTDNQAQADALQAEWKQKNEKSINWGNRIHAECENFIKNGSIADSQFKKLEDQLYKKLLKRYARNHAERILRDQNRLICGTCDHLGERSKIRNTNLVVDINDFKSNLAKGVRNESAKVENNEILKYYNRYLLYPLSHLEASDYVKYCLQLSIYGVMLEQYGVKVGSLNIYYIDVNLDVHQIYVPYMRTDAIVLMQSFINKKKINGEPISFYGKSFLTKNDSRLGFGSVKIPSDSDIWI